MIKKVVNIIKEEYKFIIIMALILFLGLFRLPYNIYVSGGTISLTKRLEIENEYQEKGSFNLTYVKSLRATIPTYLLSYVFDWEKENINDIKIDENDNASDMWKREKMYLQEANDNAIINAYKLANEEINIKKELLKVLYVDKDSETDLKTGDTILSVASQPINDFNELKEIIKSHYPGDKISVQYLRDEKEYRGYIIVREMNKEKKAGLYLIKLFDYDVQRKVTLKFNGSEGGPSGGFMTSLAIYNRLVKDDITKGRKIVGTGTIDANGNIGQIGGIKYKLKGAVKDHADIFFVPEDNYEEALKEKERKKYNINIVMVKTLSDAIEYLKR